MRVGVSGSRHGFTGKQSKVFIDMACEHVMEEFHYGDCQGVDTEALWLLVECGGGGVLHSHPATMNPDWDALWVAHTASLYPELGIVEHQAKHPLARNRDIVAAIDELWAFPENDSGRGGTWYTINRALKSGIATVVILP